MKRVYSLLVDNNPGVLSRISGLFSRRGYSIDSITAGVTADPRFTRITIVASGDELILSQIEKQVRKLEDVIEIKVLDPEDSVYRELIMVKIRADRAERAEIISVADIFRAKIVDVEKESLIVELTGTQSKLDACKDRHHRTEPRHQKRDADRSGRKYQENLEAPETWNTVAMKQQLNRDRMTGSAAV